MLLCGSVLPSARAVRQPVQPGPTTPRELDLAELLMTEMAGIDVTELHDDYAQALNLHLGALRAFTVDDVAFVQPMNLKSAFVTNSSLSVYARG